MKSAAKSRDKELNYKVGVLKRKFGIKKSDKTEPGTLISKANESKSLSKRDIAIRGLI